MVKAFKKNKVEVVTLTPAEYDAWLKVAQDSSYKQFAKRSVRRQEADRRSARGEVGRIARRPAGLLRRPRSSARVWGTHMDAFIRGITLRVAGVRAVRRRADRSQRRGRLRDGDRPLRAQRQHDLADRFRHLQPRRARPSSAAPYLLLTRGHVNVDVLPLYLGPKGRYWLALAAALMSFAFCAVMAVLTFNFWHEAWENNWRSESMWRARLWIPYLVACRSAWASSACNTLPRSSSW